jgi:GNAT superfamily N-acetyltransferase
MDNKKILQIAMQQQAIDYNCAPDDFCSSENVVVISNENPKARAYLELPFFCALTSFGNNIVASVNESIADFVSEYINDKKIEDCFAPPNIFMLNDELRKHGCQITFCAQRSLPDINLIKPISCVYELRIIQPDEYLELYDRPEWSSVTGSGKRKHLDRTAIGAYDGDKLIGLVGCQASCDSMWQMGTEVLPDYRRKGVAKALTAKLTLELLSIGVVPFSGNRWANLPSLKTQLSRGFKPAWVEMTAGAAV